MKKIFLIIFLLIFPIATYADTAVWVENEKPGPSFYEVNTGYKTKELPNCKKLNMTLPADGAFRQGDRSGYTDASKTALLRRDKGIFDCQLDKNEKIIFGLIEGYMFNPQQNAYAISYKTENNLKYVYGFDGKNWISYNCPLIQIACSVFMTNKRSMTENEIVKAKKMISFYDGLNLNKKSTPFYGDNFPRPPQ